MRLREGNKEKDIIDAAIEVFAEKGYHNSKISDIALKAGVAAGSIYLYYANKDELLFKIFEKPWIRLLDLVRNIPSDDNLNSFEKMDLLVDSIFDLLSSSPPLTLVFLREQQHLIPLHQVIVNKYVDEFLETGVSIIKSGMQEGVMDKDINAKVTKSLFYGGVRFLLQKWAVTPEDFPLEELRKDVKSFIKKGLQV